jgi:hypothetical protein
VKGKPRKFKLTQTSPNCQILFVCNIAAGAAQQRK